MSARRSSDELIVEMYGKYSSRAIARATGLTLRTVQRAEVRLRLRPPGVMHPPVTEERLAQARRLFDEDGLSPRQVAEIMHFSRETMNKHFADRKWTPEQSIEAAVLSRQFTRLQRNMRVVAHA